MVDDKRIMKSAPVLAKESLSSSSTTSVKEPTEVVPDWKKKIKQIEQAFDGKIVDGDEPWLRASILLHTIAPEFHILQQGGYRETMIIWEKVQKLYQELEEIMAAIHQKSRNWWHLPFTSTEELTNRADEIVDILYHQEQQLFQRFVRDTRKNACAALSEKKYKVAIVHLTLGIALEYDNYKIYGNRSECYLKLGYPQLAFTDAEKALKLNPEWEEGYLHMGSILYSLGKFQSASEEFQKGLAREPENQNLRAALLESNTATKTEKCVKIAMEKVAKKMDALGVEPSHCNIKILVFCFLQKFKRFFEDQTRETTNFARSPLSNLMAEILTTNLRSIQYTPTNNECLLNVVRAWKDFKETVIKSAFNAFDELCESLVKEWDRCADDGSLPVRLHRFTTFRYALSVAMTIFLKPRRKEARKDLKDKIYLFIVNAEANRTLDGVQEAVSNIVEFTFVQECVLPLMDYISCQDTLVNLLLSRAGNEKDLLLEDETVRKERLILYQEYQNLKKVLENLYHYASTSHVVEELED